MSIQKNGSKILTGTFFLTFKSEYLPTHLFLGFERFPVDRYVPNPSRCFKCQKFGHSSRTCCSKEDVCSICASTDHSYKDCNKQDSPHCSNCSGPHKASDQECPKYLVEKATLKLQAEKRLSPKEARKKLRNNTKAHLTKEGHGPMLQLLNKLTCWSVTFSSVTRKDSFRVQSVNSRVRTQPSSPKSKD